jgi:tetratricopeptide (TPR) repeat protein
MATIIQKSPMHLPRLLLASLLLLIPVVPVNADQKDERLNELFADLGDTSDIGSIRATENQIWEIWLQHANPDVERLLVMGTERMNTRQYPEALLIFNQLVESVPDFAEAWNKRATLFYMLGNFEASIEDIETTLELEPRHFGALSGLGLVYLQQGELQKAREAFENLIEVHPHSPNAQENLRYVMERLQRDLI